MRPPSATAYEADRDALTAQFDAAEALLKEIQEETAAVRAAVEEQKAKVDAATEEVAEVVKDMKEGEARTRDEMREIRQEVDNVRDMLPKVWAFRHYALSKFISCFCSLLRRIKRANRNPWQSCNKN